MNQEILNKFLNKLVLIRDEDGYLHYLFVESVDSEGTLQGKTTQSKEVFIAASQINSIRELNFREKERFLKIKNGL